MTTPWPTSVPYTVDTWPLGTNYDGEVECYICDQVLYSPLLTNQNWRTDLTELRSLVDAHMKHPCRESISTDD
jgi:hypothetical protein